MATQNSVKGRGGTMSRPAVKARAILAELKKMANPANAAGLAHFGIRPKTKLLGVSMVALRRLAKAAGHNHRLALELWRSGIHEARIMASLVDEPAAVTAAQMDRWAAAFDSWDVCDQCCLNLFDQTPFAAAKAAQWSRDRREFVRRAGLALMAVLSVHDKMSADSHFARFLPFIERVATDERNYVKKAASWALRQIGKRSRGLRRAALASARRLEKSDNAAARWVAADVKRELSMWSVTGG